MIQIIHADVIAGLQSLPEKSVQCVVTSPPYSLISSELAGEAWGLRDYGVEGQIGLEETPEAYVARLVEVFREVRRVLKDDGTLWLNLGDSYAGSGKGAWDRTDVQKEVYVPKPRGREASMPKVPPGLKPKDLVGIPWRVAFALQADGWYLRQDIIWHKPNPMPESVTDRPTKSHEYIFLLTKKPRYYYDADAVRETCNYPNQGKWGVDRKGYENDNTMKARKLEGFINGSHRNRRTVWEIATQPFPMAHFATFPEALVEPCIKAGTSERGCCSVCGAPWERVVEATGGGIGKSWSNHKDDIVFGNRCDNQSVKRVGDLGNGSYKRIEKGWQPSCTCAADTIPCTVLDPFGGSGTVAKVARDLNRKAILIELNEDYIKIAHERLRLNEQLGTFA